MDKTDISVIIPVRDHVGNLRSTINSILATADFYPFSAEIIIINDSGNPEIKSYVMGLKYKQVTFKCIDLTPSRGSYNARNKGIEKADGDYLIFFDVPLKLEPGWLDKIKKAFDEGYDYIAGNINVDQEDCNTLAKKMYSATSFPVESYFKNQNFGPTAFLAVKKDIFDKTGLFDTVLSGGDMIFGRRVYREGYRMKFLIDAVAYHPPRNLKQQFWKKVRVYSGVYRLYLDNPEEQTSPVRFRSFFSCLTAIPANLIHYRRNKMYQSGLFTYSEYIIVVCMFWGVEFTSRLYLLLNKKKQLNT